MQFQTIARHSLLSEPKNIQLMLAESGHYLEILAFSQYDQVAHVAESQLILRLKRVAELNQKLNGL